MLCWLTVSTPFIYASQQEYLSVQHDSEDDLGNPLSNTSEEKNESNVSSFSEFLHQQARLDHLPISLMNAFKQYRTDLYFQYNPELICPLPDYSI